MRWVLPALLLALGSPETPDDLLTHEAVLQGTESWRLVDGAKIITLHPRGRFKADNAAAMVAAARVGLGIAMVPDGLLHDHVASGALVPVLRDYPPAESGVNVVRPPSQHPVRKVRVLTEMLIACFDEFPPPLRGSDAKARASRAG